MSCCKRTTEVNLDGLVAKVVIFNNVNKTVDTTGTVGTWVRIVIKRNGFPIFRSNAQLNQGTNQVPYTITLKDGDEICTQSSFTDHFQNGSYVEDCAFVPETNLAFAPIL